VVEILLYLGRHCAFLFRPRWFRFVDSRVDESFGGDAYVILESRTLRLRFTRDRGQLLLSFQPLDGRASEWFSPGLLRALFVGDRGGSEVLDEEWAAFLATSLDELERRLGGPERDATIEGLRRAARARAKELFG
jgi:hypothetical protein